MPVSQKHTLVNGRMTNALDTVSANVVMDFVTKENGHQIKNTVTVLPRSETVIKKRENIKIMCLSQARNENTCSSCGRLNSGNVLIQQLMRHNVHPK